MNIPVLDLAAYIHGTNAQKTEFAASLGSAFEETGFVAIVNHGIDQSLIDALYEQVTAFFALPTATKKQYEIEGLAGQRGYTSFGKEHAKGYEAADLKEFFQFGQIMEEGEYNDDFPPNVTVDEVPDFTPTLQQAYQAFETAGNQLLQAIAGYLGLPTNYFEPYTLKGNSILRAIYYPPITHEPASAIRAEQHEDINLITLLVGASAAGLELLSKSNEWLAITAQPGEIVVNVGDMLQRLTNNKLRSTTHRVVNPPREQWSTPRYSIPFFLHPVSEMSLACLPQCIDEAHPKAYTDYTAGQYLQERLEEIGLAKK